MVHYCYYESNPCYIRRDPSIFDAFTLTPLPYPVLLILALISLFLAMKFQVSYEQVAETTESQLNWLLLATPLLLIFAVKLLSSRQMGYSAENMCYCCGQNMGYCSAHKMGGRGSASPWGVAALIVVLLVLVQFQSTLFG